MTRLAPRRPVNLVLVVYTPASPKWWKELAGRNEANPALGEVMRQLRDLVGEGRRFVVPVCSDEHHRLANLGAE